MKTLLLLLASLTLKFAASADACYVDGAKSIGYWTTMARITKPDGSDFIKVTCSMYNADPREFKIVHTITGSTIPALAPVTMLPNDPRWVVREFFKYYEFVIGVPICVSNIKTVTIEVTSTPVARPWAMEYSNYSVTRK